MKIGYSPIDWVIVCIGTWTIEHETPSPDEVTRAIKTFACGPFDHHAIVDKKIADLIDSNRSDTYMFRAAPSTVHVFSGKDITASGLSLTQFASPQQVVSGLDELNTLLLIADMMDSFEKFVDAIWSVAVYKVHHDVWTVDLDKLVNIDLSQVYVGLCGERTVEEDASSEVLTPNEHLALTRLIRRIQEELDRTDPNVPSLNRTKDESYVRVFQPESKEFSTWSTDEESVPAGLDKWWDVHRSGLFQKYGNVATSPDRVLGMEQLPNRPWEDLTKTERNIVLNVWDTLVQLNDSVARVLVDNDEGVLQDRSDARGIPR